MRQFVLLVKPAIPFNLFKKRAPRVRSGGYLKQVKEEWLVLGRKLTIRQKFPEASYDRLLIQDFRLTQESISDEPWLRRFLRP